MVSGILLSKDKQVSSSRNFIIFGSSTAGAAAASGAARAGGGSHQHLARFVGFCGGMLVSCRGGEKPRSSNT